jgi:hypothetical protein
VGDRFQRTYIIDPHSITDEGKPSTFQREFHPKGSGSRRSLSIFWPMVLILGNRAATQSEQTEEISTAEADGDLWRQLSSITVNF